MGVSAALGGATRRLPREQQIAEAQGEAGEYGVDMSLYLEPNLRLLVQGVCERRSQPEVHRASCTHLPYHECAPLSL